ncbi:uncharacterized protein LOC118737591 [Rhagoletis pomonella]|uniref:uncharacterized protein LOC118737591 n=1 Tax=Rhagoletis pomonella TaxID=28610 RepID=UPI00177F8E08|nr:uncharacterized protein LOC118737591 [Rhagoletis pomonella]
MSIAMGRIRNKKIWLYFDRISDYAARCKNCKLNLSCKHTSANLVRHLYYKHHVDASYYGAERTGFLKQKRGRINQRSEVGLQVASAYLPPVLTATDPFDPLAVIKQEVVPLKLVRCNGSDEDAEDHEDACSVHEYHQVNPPLSSSSQHSPSVEINGNIDINNAKRTEEGNVQEAVNVQMCMENTHLKEKLMAETRYYNEMAELARSKRIMIELQSKKLMLEMETMRSS